MALSEILNVIFGTGLLATVMGLLSIRSELKKARAEAEKAFAESDTVKITNTEQATRVLVQNIVEPLREELDATRKDLNATKREIARFRKAVEAIQLCPYRDECPVHDELSLDPDGDPPGKGRQYQRDGNGGNRSGKRNRAGMPGHGIGAEDNHVPGRHPANRRGVQHPDEAGSSNPPEGQ